MSASEGVTPLYLRNPSDDPERYLDYVTRLTHRAKNGLQVLRIANELAASPAITSASVDCISEATAFSDPVVANEWVPEQLPQSNEQNIWPLRKVEPYSLRVTNAWGITRGTNHIRVAILDTGTLHPDIPAKNIDTTQDPPTTTPATWQSHHGTHVGSTLVEMFNNQHNVGVAHGTTLTSFKVATGSHPNYTSLDSAWYKALFLAQVDGARVVNMSVTMDGLPTNSRTALNMGRGGGIVNFAAIGQDLNGGAGQPNTQQFPAAETSIFAVPRLARGGSAVSMALA